MESKFGSMTIPELRQELKRRNARLSGRKKELVERLVAYEKNNNFGQLDTLDKEYVMTLPDSKTYFDVNSDSKFTGVTMEEIHSYLSLFEKPFDSHIYQLYSEKFLRYYRVSTTDGIFIKSNCHAEMKSGVTYTVDVELDCNGSVIEAQCECAAGMGPHAHCKHVCVVLYGAAMFQLKREIKTEETCTQKLQSFHHVKRFTGSPIKASALEIPGADEFSNMDFDPRPVEFRNSGIYQDYFRNTCLNFNGISKMPIFQTFEPANTYALAHDHDYLQLSPEDIFLNSISVGAATSEQVSSIEKLTRGQSNNTIWKEERCKRLTSSMYGKICKLTDRTDKEKFAKSLLTIKNIKAASLEHGKKHEKVAIKKFESDFGVQVQSCGLIICKEYPFLASSPDGFIDSDTVVEVKCPYTSREKLISTTTVPYLKLHDNKFDLDPTHDYFYQIQGQLLCTNAKKCVFIVCTADKLKVVDIKYITIMRDDAFISELLRKLEDFYHSYFQRALLEKLFYRPL